MMQKWRGKIKSKKTVVTVSLLVVLMLLGSSGVLLQAKTGRDYSLNKKEAEMVDLLTKNGRARYMGYYSVELPEDFTPMPGMFMLIHGTKQNEIETDKKYYPAFQNYLTNYEADLNKKSVLSKEDLPFIKNIYPLSAGMKGVIFEHIEEGREDAFRLLDGFKWEGDTLFSVKIKASDGRDKKYDKDRRLFGNILINNVPEKKAQLLTLLKSLQPRKDSEPPEKGRLALKYAQIDPALLGGYEFSYAYINSRGVEVVLGTDNSEYTGVPLLETDPRVMEMSRGKTIYKGRRNVNGLEVSEWLISRVYNDIGSSGIEYSFTLNIHQDKANNSSPLSLIMNYTTQQRAREDILSEAELVALWQHITETIKYYK
ncbi:T6SS immunity protein Tli4 family protein [Kalamiella sp. sgz302252]|uniref:T6SS immunity protein Tli4 family protein n=1 Tax=Pantoea sp. sgz302252 TaxID=3341827 RepID=UPI0036D23351